MINIKTYNKFFLMLFIILLILIQIGFINAGGIDGNDLKNLEKVNAELRAGNFNNLIATIEKTDITHSSILFNGLDNSKLIEAWNKLEIKKANGDIDSEKTNKYRQMIVGLGDTKSLDSFIGNLIKSNIKAKEFEFKGSENAKGTGSIIVKGDFIELKDPAGNVHKVPLKDLKGFKKIVFAEISGGGQGYAVHYIPEKGSESGAILSSGYLKGDDKNGYDVMDSNGKEIKIKGHINFGDNPQGAVYFRGIPKEVSGQKFSKGDYIFNKPGPGRAGDISFKDETGSLSSSERDILNSQGLRVGYQSETGVRGVKIFKLNVNKIIDIAHQNGVGIKYGDVIVGENSDKRIEINNKGQDIVVSASGIINTQITNNNGKVFFKDNNGKEINSGIGEPLKIVNGVINGNLVNRQDSGAGSNGRFNFGYGNSGNPGANQGSIGNNLQFISQGLNPNQGQNNQNGNQGNQLPPEAQASLSASNVINKFRGKNLQWDQNLANGAAEWSKYMANNLGRLRHANLQGFSGENIAMFTSPTPLSPQEVGARFANQWINSRDHRENILSKWGSTGIGVYVKQSSRYGYEYYATERFK